jgi:hypothetical protein
VKENCRQLLSTINNPGLRKKFDDITANEQEWLNIDSVSYLKRKTDELESLAWQVRRKDAEYVTQLYLYYALKPDEEYKDQKLVKELKKRGDDALTRKNADEILGVVYKLYDQLIDKNKEEPLEGTGLRG